MYLSTKLGNNSLRYRYTGIHVHLYFQCKQL